MIHIMTVLSAKQNGDDLLLRVACSSKRGESGNGIENAEFNPRKISQIIIIRSIM